MNAPKLAWPTVRIPEVSTLVALSNEPTAGFSALATWPATDAAAPTTAVWANRIKGTYAYFNTTSHDDAFPADPAPRNAVQ